MGRSGAVVILCFLLACSSPSEDFIAEAKSVHHMSLLISDEVSSKIDELTQHAEGLPSADKLVLMDSIRRLANDLMMWKENLIKVREDNQSEESDQPVSGHQTPEVELGIQEGIRLKIIQLNTRSQHILDQINQQE